MRRLVLALATAPLALVLVAGPAAGHAILLSADPADGTVHERGPGEIVLRFTEVPDPELSEIRVIDAEGQAYHRGEAESLPDDPASLRVEVADLPDGVYTVTWRAFSTVDGHVTGGAYAFGVNVDPDDVQPAADAAGTPPLSPLEVAGRWIFYAGVILLLGAVWMGALLFGGAASVVHRLAWAGLAAAGAGSMLLAAAQRSAAGVGIGRFVQTGIGRAAAGRVVALAAATVVLLVASRLSGRARKILLLAAGAGAAAAAFVHVGAGHAAAGAAPSLHVVAQWTHLLAAGVWIGGLAALLAGVRGAPGEDKAVAVRCFSAVALVAVAVVAGTGTVRALDEVGSWSALLDTGYGRLVTVKIVLLVVLVGLAAVNRYRNVPEARTSLRSLRRVSGAELGIAAVVFVATALLASLIPSGSAVTGEGGIRVEGSDPGTTVRVVFAAEPGYAGTNDIEVTVVDFDTGEPAGAERVAVRFEPVEATAVPETTLELDDAGDGVWRGRGGNLAVPGLWRVVVLVQRGVDSAEVRLTVATRCRTTSIATAGQPTLHNVELGEGRSVQGYLDPGEPGANDAHFTFFGADGDEMPITGELRITALGPDGEPVDMEVRRFSPGHYIGNASMEEGRWWIGVIVLQADGERLTACFEERI